ncbi:MAG: hypothetical protein E2O41_05425 [Nitrospina sp.]|nr:MAG: hypothetical protein E2O41_05425 [Nitrospina sp.]
MAFHLHGAKRESPGGRARERGHHEAQPNQIKIPPQRTAALPPIILMEGTLYLGMENKISKKTAQGSLSISGSVFWGLSRLLGFQGFSFKLPEFPTIGVPGPAGFSGEIIQHKLFFKVMAYPALLCQPKDFPLVRQYLVCQMCFRDKIPVEVATLAIFTDHPVIFPCGKFSIESLFNIFGVATGSDDPQQKENTQHNPISQTSFF